MLHGSQHHIGVREHTMYPVGTRVVFFIPAGEVYGVILGAIGRADGHPSHDVPDYVERISGNIRDNEPHREDLDIKGAVPTTFNVGRPYDSLPGEIGWMSQLGVGLNLGLLSAMMRAGDTNGIVFSYLSQLTRLMAHNYQFWSSVSHEEQHNDQGELHAVKEFFRYPWEAMGAAKPEIATTEANEDQKVEAKGKDPQFQADVTDDFRKLKYTDQMSVPRIQEFLGQLGDLFRKTFAAPRSDLEQPVRLQDEVHHTGLAETVVHADGMVEIRSVSGVLLEKAVHIPVAKRMKRVGDPGSDTLDPDSKYSPSDQFGEPDDKKHAPPEPDTKAPTASLPDELAARHAYGLSTLYRHPNDWLVSDEKKTEAYEQTNHSVTPAINKPFHPEQFAPAPEHATIELDHRPEHSTRLFKCIARIYINKEGSLIIEDAHGSQITTFRGNMTLTAPGDITVRPGRNFNVMAPGDINLRAGTNLDATAGTGDLRLKAENNLHALAGNSGTGAVLIESRGKGLNQEFTAKYGTDTVSNGVILLAKDSSVNAYGNHVYLRSISGGRVVLDASSGQGGVDVWCGDFDMMAQNSYGVQLGTAPGSSLIPSQFEYRTGGTWTIKTDRTTLDADAVDLPKSGVRVQINGDLNAESGQIDSLSSNVVVAYTVATSSGETSRGTPVLTTQDFAPAFANLATADGAINDAQKPAVEVDPKPYYDDSSLGGVALIRSIGFSCRDDTRNQYLVEDWTMEETRWQQMYRISGTNGGWEESIVAAPDGYPTMPFPGYRTWTSLTSLQTFDPKWWTQEDGETYGLQPYLTEPAKSVPVIPAAAYQVNV
jgi:hypothetical protein